MVKNHKRIRHYHEPGDCHELTFSCYHQRPLLTNNAWRKMLSVSVDRAMQRHRFGLIALVYMPEHVHLLVYPRGDTPRIDGLLKAIKRPFSYRVKRELQDAGSLLLKELTVRERPGTYVFRFWQEGPGYDRNLSCEAAVQGSIDYIHMNPVRRGLCERAIDWKWSSARWYLTDGPSMDADLPYIHGLPPGFFVSR